MSDEKYVGYCFRCIEFPVSGNSWCTLCYKSDEEKPTGFWGLTDGNRRFFYKCECGFETPRDITKSQAFDEILVDHFFTDHKMHIQDAQKATLEILKKEVISKYLVSNPKRQ